MIGTNTSQISAQVTNIEQDGFWLLANDREYFAAFEDYPDFRNATIAQGRSITSEDHSKVSTGRTCWT